MNCRVINSGFGQSAEEQMTGHESVGLIGHQTVNLRVIDFTLGQIEEEKPILTMCDLEKKVVMFIYFL